MIVKNLRVTTRKIEIAGTTSKPFIDPYGIDC